MKPRAPRRLRTLFVPALFIVFAGLLVSAYGAGTMLNDGQASLHIDPLKFLTRLFYAWNPELYLGTHTGYWFPYEMPYGWVYGAAQALHVSQELAQRVAVYVVYFGCLVSMYYCLDSVAPRLHPAAKLAGASAYLFNLYVALNSQAQIVWLLTYGVLPALVGVAARVLRGEMNVLRASLGVALLTLVGGGVNPPLLGINIIVLSIFVIVMVAFSSHRAAALKRVLPFVIGGSVATVTINLYWLVPFGDYFRTVWLGGVLSESPAMHNADTSFANVLRGLGHWAAFSGFDGRAYFPWAFAYAAGIFSALLWAVPIVAFGGLLFRRNQRTITLYFLLVAIVSVPLVVGYYHDALGASITTPVYDVLYRDVPGFQMFRFSYKWVAGVEFAICALYAFSTDAMVARLRDRRAILLAAAGSVAIPIVVLIPVLQYKTNYPAPVLPSWVYREGAFVGSDQRQRLALLPTQYLEQFDWGDPQFYIEDSLVERPMLYGVLGSEPQEGSDNWIRGAYRAMRDGLAESRDMFRVLGVDTILQRDDFIPAIDFSSLDQYRLNDITLTHDLIGRVLGGRPVRSLGPLRLYHLSGALPLFYGTVHPRLNSIPVFSDTYLGNVQAMAAGAAEFQLPERMPSDLFGTLEALSPILPGTADQVRDLAISQVLARDGIRVHPPSQDVTGTAPFKVKSGGRYVIFAQEQSLLFHRPPPKTLQVDDTVLPVQPSGGAWALYGSLDLAAGMHTVSDGYPDPTLVVAVVKTTDLAAWTQPLVRLQRALPSNLSSTRYVDAPQTRVRVNRAGSYRIAATAVPIAADSLIRTHLQRHGADRFFSAAAPVLTYLPAQGVASTAQIAMPQAWYRLDRSAYRWQRGDPFWWLLFSHDAHVRVFVPGGRDADARVSLRLSRLQVSTMDVAVGGAVQRRIDVPGPAPGAQAYDGPDALTGPVPVPLRFTLRLRPGWNDVEFRFDSLPGEPTDFGSAIVAAAVAPDLSFTRLALGRSRKSRANGPLGVVAVVPPPGGLAGDPVLQGHVTGTQAQRVWLAVALAAHGRIVYRVFAIPQDGDFACEFAAALPNSWNDDSDRLVGIWFVSRRTSSGKPPEFTHLAYTVHAMPRHALRNSSMLDRLAVLVDGKAVGSKPVALSAGLHLVEATDSKLKIGRLTIDPVHLPETRSFAAEWKRRSPVLLDVRVRPTSRPFLLVFNEAYHPEWHASLAGKALVHVVANGFANGWIVPAVSRGGVTIVLSFAAQRYYIAAAVVSLVSLIALIVLAYATPLGRRRSRAS